VSNYTSAQKTFLWGTGIVLGSLIFLPATYGVYAVCERGGGLVQSLIYSLYVIAVFFGLQLLMI